MQNLILKFLSRKFLSTVAFGGFVPVLFHQLGISDQVTMAAMALAAAYHVANSVESKTQ